LGLLMRLGLALAVVSSVVALIPALVVYYLAQELLAPGMLAANVIQPTLTAIASVEVRLALLAFGRVNAAIGAVSTANGLRTRLAAKIATLPLGEIVERDSSTFKTLAIEDVGAVELLLRERLLETGGAAAALIVAAAILFVCDWRLALVALGSALVATLFARPVVSGRKNDAAVRRAADELSAAVLEAMRTLSLEKSLPPQLPSGISVESVAAEYRRATRLQSEGRASAQALRRALALGVTGVTVLAGASLYANGTLGLPALILFAVLGLRTVESLVRILRGSEYVRAAFAAVDRIADFLEQPSMPEGTREPGASGELAFVSVGFGYDGPSGRRPVLHGVSFRAEPGAVTALVGPSGCGKTTVTRLAARFWDADSGRIEIGGVDVRSIPLDVLMRRISFVFQDVSLLDDTIAANIRLGFPEASDEQVVAAARAARAHEFIERMPAGYATPVGERGLSLSRGERQRIQIARALLKDAPIVILDEPTASMDPQNELLVQEALAPLFTGKTVLVVAHRLSTVVAADKIVVFDEGGTVAAEGTHEQLLRGSPQYARMWFDYTHPPAWSLAENVG
jgi:ATP-binding cassette subfamily B protein